MSFELVSEYKLSGDQENAVDTLVDNFNKGHKEQILLGATGTGKTFTMCNVIKKLGKPTIILAHNKTLAGQLYSEVKEFFPHNHVAYFISYYDYYQPEAYNFKTDTYIEKDAKINEEIDEMRHNATSALIDFDDVVIVASVSCIYGIGDPDDYKNSMMTLRVGDTIRKEDLIERLVEMQFTRNMFDVTRGSFRVRGDSLEIIPASEHKQGIRIEFFDDEIERIRTFDVITGLGIDNLDYVNVFSATHFVTNKQKLEEAIRRIKAELEERIDYFKSEGKPLEAERIEQRTRYDVEMLEQMGTCRGIENYSRHLTLRQAGETPSTLLDFFEKDYLLIIDESHMSVPQINGMYGGDKSRKDNLINYGFRLPSAYDNRPLMFNEFESKVDRVLYVSATPGKYEMDKKLPIVEQIIRPTGLLDPIIEVRQTEGQIDDLYNEINIRKEKNERVIITTLTKNMAEELTDYYKNMGLSVVYIHDEIKSLERLEILRDLRLGVYDVIIGVNLLKEGLDLPEVSLVAILDADKQGLFRSERALIQTIGRAARNENGIVIMYADSMSDSMNNAIKETNRRREIQMKYNQEHGIIPHTVIKPIRDSVTIKKAEQIEDKKNLGKDVSPEEKLKLIEDLEAEMNKYASELNFEMAAQIRDLIIELKK